ncbi:breast cancer type 1 susceptibility protein isoform X2 [Myiozetetes cayanensis]|uniref:breast cancer type 1 susceptibility protein isoform X2 n=1 Tax=Myiozetetes cayanensis TaxID=478635 RepID=UPI00215DF0AD|nr:breast cancer type 1 susceptibility protein isoform X2 [Myiozetetes cayanensis]
MDSSVITVGHIQNVLSAMQKNLECPICLDVLQEPVSTKCDHIFCRFCMFKLLSKKKKGVVQCPLCKTEVTKRSLKENSRFKQLIEGVLETIHAFELDTGVKFLKSHQIHKTSTEATAAEFVGKESSVVQSRGFRNRRKGAEENGQENFTLETAVNPQLTDTRVKRRNKPQKCDPQKGVYVELGSESSEEFFKQASKTGLEDKAAAQISPQGKPEELENVEKGSENSYSAQPDKLCAKEITLPNIIGESGFSKEGSSKESAQSVAECAKPGQVNVTECQSPPLNALPADLSSEQCDRISDSSPTVNRGTSFLESTEETDEEQTQSDSKNEEFDLKDSSGCRLGKSKEVDAVEVSEPENDSFHDKELPQEKLLQAEKTLPSAAVTRVSRKRLKRSIQKVNEWFSKSNEILSSSSSLDDSADGATDVSDEGDARSSEKECCISENTDPVVDSVEIAVVERNKRRSNQTADSIKDKIFGKTYRRERKSNPPSTVRDILSAAKKEDVAADKSLNNSSRDRPKSKRKTAHVLQPEDFIRKKDTEEAGGGPQSVSRCPGDAEKERCDGSVAVNESHLSQNRVDNTLTEREEGGGAPWKKATEKATSKHRDGEPKMRVSDQKSAKKSSAAKRCRHSTRTMCALQLVVDRNSVSPEPAEPQIDSYPSSGEPRRADSEHTRVRRSRRLQALSEEMAKETGKGVIKEPRKNHSDHGGSALGDQRNVAAQAAECKELREPRGALSFEAVAGLKGGDLEANEVQVSLKSSSDTAETGKSLFNPAPSCQPANCGSFAPHAGSQDSEIPGSPVLLQPPSVPAEQTASHQTQEVTESLTAFPQECGHDSQTVPGDFRPEKLPLAKTVLELAKEAEDSDLDTQYLRNIFRHSKRLSFSLYQAPRQTPAAENPDSETLNPSLAAQVGNKDSKDLQAEDLQEERTTAESLSEKEKLKSCGSACVDHVSCSAISTEDRQAVSQAAKEGTLTPVRTGAAGSEAENQSLKGKQGSEKAVSTDTGIESELRQNPVRSNRSQSEQSNTEEHDSKQTSLNTGHEISESNLKEKTKVVDDKEPILHFQSGSMICPPSCQQSPAEFSHDVIGKKSSKRKQIEGNEEQATQTASTAVSECLVAEALRGNSGFTGLSDTPDGLLCSDSEENTSFGDTDRREQSAVFVKGGESALGKELHDRNAGSQPRSRGFQKPRRRAQKLPSSDEESCEEEDPPCFQSLIFGKSVSTPLQVDKQVASVIEGSASPDVLPHSGSNGASMMQKMPEVAPGNACVSPSQESECSVNLFSSQSMSEESVNDAQELKKPLPQVDASEEVTSVNESKETLQSCDGRLKRTNTSSKDECQEDPTMGANLGEASGYESETSIVEDSCEPFSQGEILTTQQKNAMQNSLKKLQQEMAVLEAALKQQGSQACELLPVNSELPRASSERTRGMEQMGREKGRSPELLLPSSESCLVKRPDLEKGPECENVLKSKAPCAKTKPVQEAVQEYRQCQLKAENAEEQESGTRQNSASASSNLSANVIKSPNNSSSSLKPLNPRTAEASNGSVVSQNTNKSRGPGHRLKRNVCCPAPVLPSAAGKENAASPVVTKRKQMSIVASGLNHSEHLVVQKFVRKTQSTLSNHITEGTTHVIMKTDEELVCERTLKYFLGIAGRKWVVSYQWVIQSLKEERILDEEKFEVRGDVINGRNHQGPKRARQAGTGKIFKGFEICCCGPFTDMATEHLEWMVELCGASVVKQLHLFTHSSNSTAVVVVQPDAWKENTDYRAMQQQNNIAMVTREWVLDSVACYECQKIDAYLLF